MCIGARDADHRFLTRTARETCGALERKIEIVGGREKKKNRERRSHDDKRREISLVFLVFWQSIRIRGVRNLGYISHLKVVDIRRWSIPKEGCYAVRNVIIIGVCFLLFNGNNKYQTRGEVKRKKKKMWIEIQSDRLKQLCWKH